MKTFFPHLARFLRTYLSIIYNIIMKESVITLDKIYIITTSIYVIVQVEQS